MNLKSDSNVGAFGAASWLRDLPPNVVRALENSAQSLTVKTGQRVSEIGDPADSLIGIDQGAIAIHIDDEEQQDIIGHLFWPGDWYGVASVLFDTPRFVGSSALTDSRILLIPKKSLESIAENHPILWRNVAVLATQNVMLATRIARDNLLRTPTEKCVATLDRLVGRQSLPCDLPITQQQLADVSGLSRAAVAKVLSELEFTGHISRGYAAIRVEVSL